MGGIEIARKIALEEKKNMKQIKNMSVLSSEDFKLSEEDKERSVEMLAMFNQEDQKYYAEKSV